VTCPSTLRPVFFVHSRKQNVQSKIFDLAAKQPHAVQICRLTVSALVIHVNYTGYYSFTDHKGMEGWVGLVGWHTAGTLPTKWSRVSHRQGKVRQPKTDVLTTEPRRQSLSSHPSSEKAVSPAFHEISGWAVRLPLTSSFLLEYSLMPELR